MVTIVFLTPLHLQAAVEAQVDFRRMEIQGVLVAVLHQSQAVQWEAVPLIKDSMEALLVLQEAAVVVLGQQVVLMRLLKMAVLVLLQA
jgi:hypothetical protein